MNKNWTVLQCLEWTTNYLQEKGVENPRLDSEWMLSDLFQFSRVHLYLQFDRPMEPIELKNFRQRVQRRAKREPLQYILGHQIFHDVEVEVGPGVFIPRPETEVLVEEALKMIPANGNKNYSVLEIGTGSANIPLALVKARPHVFVDTIECSIDAFERAQKNINNHLMADQIQLWHGDCFARSDLSDFNPQTHDMIISNPPYIAQKDINTLAPEVSQYEPRMALNGGEDGLDIIRKILKKAPQYLKIGGVLLLEIGEDQQEEIHKLSTAQECWKKVRFVSDLNHKPRVFCGQYQA